MENGDFKLKVLKTETTGTLSNKLKKIKTSNQ